MLAVLALGTIMRYSSAIAEMASRIDVGSVGDGIVIDDIFGRLSDRRMVFRSGFSEYILSQSGMIAGHEGR